MISVLSRKQTESQPAEFTQLFSDQPLRARGGGAAHLEGAGWEEPQMPPPDLDNLPSLGANTSADATNRLAVYAPATLLTPSRDA